MSILNCEFNTVLSGYRCNLKGKHFPDINLVPKFEGHHEAGKTDNDVTKICFKFCVVDKVPQGLTKQFPNLQILSIIDGVLRVVSNHDLNEYKNLKELNFSNNKIDGLGNLSSIDFRPKFAYCKVQIDNEFDRLKKAVTTSFSQEEPEIIRQFFENRSVKVQKMNIQHVDQNPREIKLKPAENHNLNLFCDDLQQFVKDESTKDFQIQINEQKFQVHKFLIAARSPTLAEILKNNPEVENLKLVDISVEIFEIILKFFYTDELPGDDGTDFLSLFVAAGKLKIEELKNYAATKIIEKIDENNANLIFKIASNCYHRELQHKSLQVIKKKYPRNKFEDNWIYDIEKVEKLLTFLKKMEIVEKSLDDI